MRSHRAHASPSTLSPHAAKRIALVIWGCFILLGVIYSIINPIFESPDEIYHYAYIKHLADGNGLPVQRPGVETAYAQEGSQPPLYYALGAALTLWVDTSDFPQIIERNPHARIGIGLAQDNQNLIIHSEAERWPWHGTTLAVHLLRLASVVIAAGTVWGVYRLASISLPSRPLVAIGAMALTAFNPMFIYLGASINNDNLITLLATWALVQLAQIIHKGDTPARKILLGVTVGLAALAKVSGLALFPLTMLAFAIAPLANKPARPYPWKEILRALGVVCGCALLISGRWYIRNWILYGEPTGIKMMLTIFGHRNAPTTLKGAWEEFVGFRISYWGLFGAVNVAIKPLFIVSILEGLLLIGALGLLYHWLTLKRERAALVNHGHIAATLGILAVWVVLIHLALLRWTTLTWASQGRLTFPAIGAISLLVALGWQAWDAKLRKPLVTTLGCLLLGVIAVVTPWATIKPAYAPPPILTPEEIPPTASAFGATYGDAIALVAYQVTPMAVNPGQEIQITLYWQALAPMEENYSLYLHLFGKDGQKIGFRDSHAGMGKYPTSRWRVGEVIKDTYMLPVSPEAQGPFAAWLEVGIYSYPRMERLLARDGQGRPVGQTVLTRIKIRGPNASLDTTQRLEIPLEGGIRLLGVAVPTEEVAPGEMFPITLFWEAAPLGEDYHVFVHLEHENGLLLGQGDGPPLEGGYPTRFWETGEVLADPHWVHVDENAPPGQATLYVGLYSLQDGHRLAVLGDGAPDNRIPAAQIQVRLP